MDESNKNFLTKIINVFLLIVVVSILFNITPVIAADASNAKDHPLVSRYEGSEIINYQQETFTEFYLLNTKAKASGGIENNIASTTILEGRVTMITYRSPPERTTLEVFRNYENALSEEGFETIFTCKNKECGGRKFSHAIVPKKNYNRLGESYKDQRYLAAKLSNNEGEFYVSLYVGMASVGGGVDFKRAITQLHVIEVEAMQENMVIVDADAMAKGIGEEGRIALYGILFDHDSATIKPESKETLDQISTLLSDNPKMEIVIVGHTDNQGTLEYNLDLSKRRAEAVKAALVQDYSIDANRLSSWGVGYLSPIATNRNDAGRSKNRRVELVEK